MRIPIKALCEEKRKRSDGKALIYLQYFHDGEHRIFLNTEIAIPPEYWDKRRQCVKDTLPKSFGNPASINKEVHRQLSLASDLVVYTKDQGLSEIGAFVKEKFSPTLVMEELIRQRIQADLPFVPEARKKKEGFFLQLDLYVQSKEKKVKKATITVYNNMIGHFRAFEKHRNEPITFNSFDYQFYEDFIDFLTFKYQLPRKKAPVLGLRLNTIGKTIHHFHMFILDPNIAIDESDVDHYRMFCKKDYIYNLLTPLHETPNCSALLPFFCVETFQPAWNPQFFQ